MNSLKRAQALATAVRSFRALQQQKRFLSASQERVVIDVDSKTGIATVAMNSPPVNGLDSKMLTSCTEAAKFVEKENDIRGAIVTSNFNGSVFCAGFNILDMYQKDRQHLLDYWGCVQDWFIAWYGCKKPTAAVINGHAPAGGCAFAMTCDYRVMQSDGGKTIGLNETQLGICAPFFFVDVMRNTIGHRNSELALLLGTLFSAEEAKQVGLVDQIDELENVAAVATGELRKLTAIPPAAFAITKMSMRQDVVDKLKKVRKQDAENFAMLVSQSIVQEHIGKYLQSLKARKS